MLFALAFSLFGPSLTFADVTSRLSEIPDLCQWEGGSGKTDDCYQKKITSFIGDREIWAASPSSVNELFVLRILCNELSALDPENDYTCLRMGIESIVKRESRDTRIAVICKYQSSPNKVTSCLGEKPNWMRMLAQ